MIGAGPAIQWVESDVEAGDLSGDKQKLKGQIKMPYIYEIPYRLILPQYMKNLLIVSGKSISNAVLRQMSSCMVLGQAGGIASAIIAQTGCNNDKINLKELQKALLKQNVYLTDEKRLREMNISL